MFKLKLFLDLKINSVLQTSGYQWGEGKGKGQYKGQRLRGTNYLV